MVVRTNTSAMNTNRMLGNITKFTIADSVEKLSSGYRINRAADDVAGLSISEGMRSQIRGLTQATRNTQEGISLIQIAEGGLNEVTEILQRMNELAVQSANGIYQDGIERDYIDQEVRALMEEIDRIAEDTKFNGISLLKADSIPLGTTEVNTIEPSTMALAAVDVMPISGVTGDFAVSGGTYGTDYTYDSGVLTILSSKDLTITTNGIATTDCIVVDDSAGSANLTLSNVNIDLSKKSFGTAFYTGNNDVNLKLVGNNNLISGYGMAGLRVDEFGSVTLDGTGSLTAIGGWQGAGIGGDQGLDNSTSGTITINGGTIIATTSPLSSSQASGIGSAPGVTSGAITINGGTVIATGGHCATGIGSGGGSVGDILITGGTVIATGGYLSAAIGGGYWNKSCGDVVITGGTVTAIAYDGYDGIGTGLYGNPVEYSISNVLITVPQILEANTDYIVQIGDGEEQIITTDNNGELGFIADNYTGETVKVMDSDRNEVFNSSLMTSYLQLGRSLSFGDDTLNKEHTIYFHVGCESDDYIDYTIKDMSCASIGIEKVSLSTQESSRESIEQIQEAIESVVEYRAYMGAMQNRLEATSSNLMNVIENTTNAESRIRDTDMSTEMVAYSNAKIIQQVGQAMLAQANSTNDGVLGLL
ncbi:MAG: flagellin [Eubacteriales bacterium]